MVAAAATGLLSSPALASPLAVVSDGFPGTGNEGGAGGTGEVGRAGGSGLRFNTVVVVDAGSSGCRLNVYRVHGEVRTGRS